MNWLWILGIGTPLACLYILWDACKNAPMNPNDLDPSENIFGEKGEKEEWEAWDARQY